MRKAEISAAEDHKSTMKASAKRTSDKGCLYGCLSLLAAVILFVFWIKWMLFGNHAAFAEHVASYERTPPSARDISWYESRDISSIVSYDFLISEADFKSWLASRRWEPIDFSQTSGGFRFVEDCRRFIHPDEVALQRVINGLIYERRTSNGGGVTVVYDRDKGRAYVNSSSR